MLMLSVSPFSVIPTLGRVEQGGDKFEAGLGCIVCLDLYRGFCLFKFYTLLHLESTHTLCRMPGLDAPHLAAHALHRGGRTTSNGTLCD